MKTPKEFLSDFVECANASFAEATKRISNVRMGPIEGGRGWVLFDMDRMPFRMPDPYPEIIQGYEHTEAAKRLCVRAILTGTAECTELPVPVSRR